VEDVMQASADQLWRKLESVQRTLRKLGDAEARLAASLPLRPAFQTAGEHKEKPVADDVQ
jgi:hypothetical protein